MRSILRLALLAALVACGGGGATTQPDAGQNLAAVVFVAHVPESTPEGDAIYVTGNFQDWNPGSASHRLAPAGTRTYSITLAFPLGTRLEFKLTRGSFATVEKGARGEDMQNRAHEVIAPATLDLTVGSWADQSASTIVGDVDTTTVPGFLQGRRVWVYLPPGYNDGTARYPVLYMLDGQNLFDRVTSFAGEWQVDETLERLIPAGEIEPLIVVGIDNAGSSRIDEYTPWFDSYQGRGGGGGAQLAAIADILRPAIDASYRTLTGPTHTGIAGSSLGGLMALYATFARPDVFGRNAAVSPSIWWAGRMIVAYAASSPRPAALLWTDMGTAEYDTAIVEYRYLCDTLLAGGFVLDVDLKVVEDPGAAHNEAAWSRRFPDMVRFLFPPPD